MSEFIGNFREAYQEKLLSTYRDSTLTYVPAVTNLVEYYNSWRNTPIIQRRIVLWKYLNEPILADDEAFDLRSGERYIFPIGTLKQSSYQNEIRGPISHKLWYYSAVQVPLTEFLKNNPFDYVFTIINLGSDKISGKFWIIRDENVFVLLYDYNLRIFTPVEAHLFLADIAEDAFFTILGK